MAKIYVNINMLGNFLRYYAGA